MSSSATPALRPTTGYRLETSQGPWWFALGAILAVLCLVPAWLNGSPPVFTDTQGYLANMREFRPSHMRAFGYGAFLRATGGMLSLWLPAIAQAVLVALLSLRLLALEAPSWPRGWRAGLAVALVALLLAGQTPWLASWLMPDLFVGLMMLALLLLALHWPRLPAWQRVGLVLFLCGAASVHLTHPPMLFGLALALGAAALLASPARRAAGRLAAVVALAALCGWGGLTAANLITYKTATMSLGSPVFLFARLLEDGDVPALLRPRCEAGAGWAICRHLDEVRGMGADEFLWADHSPIQRMGWVEGFYPEARELNAVLLPQLWPQWLMHAVRRTGEQMVTIGTGDGFDEEGPRMLARDMPRFGLDWVVPIMRDSAQFENRLLPWAPVGLADALSAAGLAGVALLGVYGAARRRPGLWWPAGLFLVVWLGNAAIISLAAPVHDRYGNRLVWVAPLLAGVLAIRAAQREGAAPPAA